MRKRIKSSSMADGYVSTWKKVVYYRDSYILIAPFILLFVLLTVIPIMAAIGLSFTSFNMLEMPRFIGWQNYQRMFLDDPIFLRLSKTR